MLDSRKPTPSHIFIPALFGFISSEIVSIYFPPFKRKFDDYDRFASTVAVVVVAVVAAGAVAAVVAVAASIDSDKKSSLV